MNNINQSMTRRWLGRTTHSHTNGSSAFLCHAVSNSGVIAASDMAANCPLETSSRARDTSSVSNTRCNVSSSEIEKRVE